MPGTRFFMYLAMPTFFMGVRPARIATSSWSPISRTPFIQSLNFSML